MADRKFTAADRDTLAEFIVDEHRRRKSESRRDHLAKVWKEIDRQLRMEPDTAYKSQIDGPSRDGNGWMPEIELPLQAQTLEVLTADARELMFPDQRNWFSAHAVVSDEYLQGLASLPVAGEVNPGIADQSDANMIVEGAVQYWHSQYDLRHNVDCVNAEAFKYGTFVGRGRMVKKTVFRDTAQGTVREDASVPVLAPTCLKTTYLDSTPQRASVNGFMVGPATIFETWRYLKDVQMEANKGSKDPDSPTGGWMASAVKGLEEDDNGMVQLLEWEGDVVVPRKSTRDMFVPNVIATVAVGKNSNKLIRLRLNADKYSCVLSQPYHVEDYDSPYGTSPLIKGYPIQMAASESLQRLMQWAILNTEPPLQYDTQDPQFAAGPPEVAPRAKWGSVSPVTTAQIGDGGALQSVYVGLVNQYYDVTGVNAPRLGARTVSHTTGLCQAGGGAARTGAHGGLCEVRHARPAAPLALQGI